MTTTISGAKIILPSNSLSDADMATNAEAPPYATTGGRRRRRGALHVPETDFGNITVRNVPGCPPGVLPRAPAFGIVVSRNSC